MKMGIGFDDSGYFRDKTGLLHLFDPEEMRYIGKAWYKSRQKKGEGLIM